MGKVSAALALVTGLVTLATALVIRAELARPGMQIFAEGGAPYSAVVQLHGATGTAFVLATVALAAFTAGRRSMIAWLVAWPACVAMLAPLALAALSAGALMGLPMDAGAILAALTIPEREFGALVFDPVATAPPGPGLDPLHLPFALLAALQLAALALTGANTGLSRTSLVCAGLVLLCAAGIAMVLTALQTALILPLVVVSFLAVLAPLAIELSDGDGPSAPYLLGGCATGLLLCLVLAFGGVGWPRPWGLGGTMTDIATLHALTAMAPFLLAAGLHARRRTPFSGGAIWAGALALGAASAFAYLPYNRLGAQGMPRGYADFPEVFARLNLEASAAGLGLIVAILAVTLPLLRRSRGPAAPER